MADGLLLTNRLLGMTREQVVALLGPPPATNYFSEWDLVYQLGLQRSFIAIDSEWLVIRLGSNGRVQEARIVVD
jgi:outer membrane protein assembly factor BamE (lipoprotein component of BamABCDE complex)